MFTSLAYHNQEKDDNRLSDYFMALIVYCRSTK